MLKHLFLSSALLLSVPVNASLVVIGSPDLVGQMNIKDVKKLFLGKKVDFNDGRLTAIELDKSLPEKANFHRLVTKKSLTQLESYWAKQLFTGKGQAPESVMSQEDLKSKVAQGTATVGYIDESLVDNQVSTLLKL